MQRSCVPRGRHSTYFNQTNYGFIVGSFVRLRIVFMGSGPAWQPRIPV